jgi:hypothetical protein
VINLAPTAGSRRLAVQRGRANRVGTDSQWAGGDTEDGAEGEYRTASRRGPRFEGSIPDDATLYKNKSLTFILVDVGRVNEDAESELIMNRPRRDDIDPMVPELPTATYVSDGGVDVASPADRAVGAEVDAPLVPDLF